MAWQSMERDHLNKLSITFQQWDQCEIWRQLAKWFLKNHDFIHVNSSVAGKYNKHKQDRSHLGFPIRMILAIVYLQVTSILPMNFWVNCPFGSGEKVQNKIFFKMATIAAIWDFLLNNLSYFWSTNQPDASYQVSSQLAFHFRRRRVRIDFQDGCHLGFPIGTILAIYISTSHPDPSYQFSNQLTLWFRKISEKKSFKILDFWSKQFKLF